LSRNDRMCKLELDCVFIVATFAEFAFVNTCMFRILGAKHLMVNGGYARGPSKIWNPHIYVFLACSSRIDVKSENVTW
jgi:hypothetical protein